MEGFSQHYLGQRITHCVLAKRTNSYNRLLPDRKLPRCPNQAKRGVKQIHLEVSTQIDGGLGGY